MKEFAVYEQRFPIKTDWKDENKNPIFRANLVCLGSVKARESQAMEEARRVYKVRHPVLHELDAEGNEK